VQRVIGPHPLLKVHIREQPPDRWSDPRIVPLGECFPSRESRLGRRCHRLQEEATSDIKGLLRNQLIVPTFPSNALPSPISTPPNLAGIIPGVVIEAIPSPAFGVAQEPDALRRLGERLIDRRALDYCTLERARRMASETGGRLDRVLTQLGLITERDLAEVLADLVGASLLSAADYPEAPLFGDRLKPKFLRKAHALPIADNVDTVLLAMADPLDNFVSDAIAAALARRVAIAVGVPIEIEAALSRLYPESEEAEGWRAIR
jgi:Type II secretion system (T2SS), protein E, N-terminal domain